MSAVSAAGRDPRARRARDSAYSSGNHAQAWRGARGRPAARGVAFGLDLMTGGRRARALKRGSRKQTRRAWGREWVPLLTQRGGEKREVDRARGWWPSGALTAEFQSPIGRRGRLDRGQGNPVWLEIAACRPRPLGVGCGTVADLLRAGGEGLSAGGGSRWRWEARRRRGCVVAPVDARGLSERPPRRVFRSRPGERVGHGFAEAGCVTRILTADAGGITFPVAQAAFCGPPASW